MSAYVHGFDIFYSCVGADTVRLTLPDDLLQVHPVVLLLIAAVSVLWHIHTLAKGHLDPRVSVSYLVQSAANGLAQPCPDDLEHHLEAVLVLGLAHHAIATQQHWQHRIFALSVIDTSP